MKSTRRIVAIFAALTLAATACGGDGDTTAEPTGDGGDETATSEPTDGGEDTGGGGEASGEPIRIGALFDLSGPTSDVGAPYSEGVLAFVEWTNNNGGLEGRPIELLSADYAYDVAQANQLYSQFTSEGVVAFMGWGTGDTEALRPKINSDEIPFVSASYSAQLNAPDEFPYNFVVALSYSNQMRVALKHIAEQAGGEHVEVAVFHHDSPFGESPLEDGRSYIEEQGLDIGYQTYPMASGAADFIGQLAQVQDQGASYIIIQNVSSPAATLATNVADQALDATVVCLNWCADEGFIELAGAAAEGALGVLPWEPPAPVADQLADVTAYLEANGQSIDDIGLHFTQGWFQTSVLTTAIANVVASGEEVTGPAIQAEMEAMDAIETPVSVPITFSADDHQGMDAARVFEVTDSTWTAITDAISP